MIPCKSSHKQVLMGDFIPHTGKRDAIHHKLATFCFAQLAVTGIFLGALRKVCFCFNQRALLAPLRLSQPTSIAYFYVGGFKE